MELEQKHEIKRKKELEFKNRKEQFIQLSLKFDTKRKRKRDECDEHFDENHYKMTYQNRSKLIHVLLNGI